MEAQGSLTTHMDKSKDLSLGLTNGTVSANVFANGYRDADPKAFPRPTGPSVAAAGANMGVQTTAGGASVQATHIPHFGNQVTASANANLLNHKDHKVNVNAFHTTTMPKVGPNYATQGGGVNYSFKDTVGFGASTAHIPAAQMHQHSVTGNLNLHKTPNSSMDLNLGASQTTSPFGRSGWQSGGTLTFRKQF